jgi:hypothetical protein
MRFRQRGFHYLGNLGSKLADLQGSATLAQELVQNADDVGNAGFLRFDVVPSGGGSRDVLLTRYARDPADERPVQPPAEPLRPCGSRAPQPRRCDIVLWEP